MKTFAAIICAAFLAGCTFTTSASWRGPDQGAPNSDALEQRYNQLSTAIRIMTEELATTPNDVNQINAVLEKYGIPRKGK